MSRSSLCRRVACALSERRRKLSQSYVKRLPHIYIIVLLGNSLLFFLISYSLWMMLPILITFLASILFHIHSVMESARKLIYAERIIRTERWRLFLFMFSISSLFVLYPALWVLSSQGIIISELPFPFNQIASLLLVWFLFFLVTVLPISPRALLTSHRMAKLCFRVTVDVLERHLKHERVPVKDAYRHFKWLKLGFQSCNGFLIQKPYCIKVENIDQYHQRILSVALIGDRDDLKKVSDALQEVLASLGNKEAPFDLRSFLIALLHTLGKKARKQDLTNVLSEMMLVKPSIWDRTKATIRSPYTVSLITTAAFVVAVLTLVFQVFY